METEWDRVMMDIQGAISFNREILSDMDVGKMSPDELDLAYSKVELACEFIEERIDRLTELAEHHPREKQIQGLIESAYDTLNDIHSDIQSNRRMRRFQECVGNRDTERIKRKKAIAKCKYGIKLRKKYINEKENKDEKSRAYFGMLRAIGVSNKALDKLLGEVDEGDDND